MPSSNLDSDSILHTDTPPPPPPTATCASIERIIIIQATPAWFSRAARQQQAWTRVIIKLRPGWRYASNIMEYTVHYIWCFSFIHVPRTAETHVRSTNHHHQAQLKCRSLAGIDKTLIKDKLFWGNSRARWKTFMNSHPVLPSFHFFLPSAAIHPFPSSYVFLCT